MNRKAVPRRRRSAARKPALARIWKKFRVEDPEQISLAEFMALNLAAIPEDAQVRILDNYFPDATITRDGDALLCEIEEHLYTKYWEHKFSAHAFSEAMERAVLRLAHEGHPMSHPSREENDEVHIFVRWELRLPTNTKNAVIAESIKSAFDLVWHRADSILENSDSVLILGKDTGLSMNRLKLIAATLEELGYHTYIVKDQPDKSGESVIQKVLRLALSSKFVIVENTEAAGQLYELPHVAKAAECVTVVLQEEGKGATWMFEDAYGKHKHLHKVIYCDDALSEAVKESAEWAEKFLREFAIAQKAVLPWLKS